MAARRGTTASVPGQLVVMALFAVLAFVPVVRTAVFDGFASVGHAYGTKVGRDLKKTSDQVEQQARERAATAAPTPPRSGAVRTP